MYASLTPQSTPKTHQVLLNFHNELKDCCEVKLGKTADRIPWEQYAFPTKLARFGFRKSQNEHTAAYLGLFNVISLV